MAAPGSYKSPKKNSSEPVSILSPVTGWKCRIFGPSLGSKAIFTVTFVPLSEQPAEFLRARMHDDFEGTMNFTLKPVFVGWIAAITQLPLQLFLTVWAGGFFGGFSSSLFHKGDWTPFIAFGGAAFIAVPLVAYVGKKLNYARTEYQFYGDRLEFEEGFFSRNSKVVKFRDVKEVTLQQGILQRTMGLGTIYLATLATGSGPRNNPFFSLGFGNVSAGGIAIRDVSNPTDVYNKVRKLIDAS